MPDALFCGFVLLPEVIGFPMVRKLTFKIKTCLLAECHVS